MTDMPFPRRFPWLPAMAILAFSGALFLCDCLVWTPMQRYYLGSYLRCALFGTDPAVGTEVRWLYKTAPRGKKELALDTDVVPATAGDESGIPMHLSPAARQAGWTGLLQGPDEWLQTVRLQPYLEAQFYDGKSFLRLLVMPLLWGAAMFLFLLAMGSILRSLNAYDEWDLERMRWGGTSDKLDAEMEKKDRRNTIQPTGICKAEDTGDCAEGNATNTGQLSLRVAEEDDPAGAPDLRFDHRCRQRQAPRTLCIEGDEENRMRGNLPRMRFCLVHDWRGEGFPHG